MAFCDGSVHPISYAIDPSVHQSLGNRKDGVPTNIKRPAGRRIDAGRSDASLGRDGASEVDPWPAACDVGIAAHAA